MKPNEPLRRVLEQAEHIGLMQGSNVFPIWLAHAKRKAKPQPPRLPTPPKGVA